MKILSILILSTAILISACADPAANKPKAQVASNGAGAPSLNVSQGDNKGVLTGFKANGTEFPISTDESKVEFTGSKVTGKHDGGFKKFTGVIDLVEDKAEKSRVLFEIEMNSIFTDTDGVTKHLQTADFFDVEKFPKATFVSTEIAPSADGKGNYQVTGDMAIHGVEKSVTFPAKIEITPGGVTVKAEFSINRKDFGIAYAGKADDLIRDDVVLRLDLKAAKKK